MSPDTFDKIQSGFRIFFIVVAVISFFSGRWLDVIIAVLIAIYGGIFISSILPVKYPSDKELNQTVVEKSIGNIRNIRSAPKGTLHDVIPSSDGVSGFPDRNRTINFSDEISDHDLEEAIIFLADLAKYETGYERLRKMMRTQKRDEIKFVCQAHLVMAARGIARRFPWRKDAECQSLAQKYISPWSYQDSFPIFSNPESFESNEDRFKDL
jgi:hypothetical protein